MKDKKKVTLLVILIISIIGVIGFTIAYFSNNYTFDNLFTSAIYQTQTTETFTSPDNWMPGDTTPKTVSVKNTGNIEASVRVCPTESWTSSNNTNLPLEQNGERVAIINLANTDKWTKQGSCYYYNEDLEPNETTVSFIESVTFNPNVEIDLNCTTTTNNGSKTKTCSSKGNDYDNATYTLNLRVETVQADMKDEIWGTDGDTLYAILREEYKSNSGYAKLYTGNHQDSFDRPASKKIYYFTAPDAPTTYHAPEDIEYGNILLDKTNVIFAGYCWQMLRTTDTGGVKMIYNGVPVDGKCTNSTSRNTNGLVQGSRTTNDMNASYAYGSDFTYDLDAKTYKITGTIKENINYSSDKSVIGMYTCKNANKDATCTTLYYLQEENSSDTNKPYVHPFTIASTNYASIGTTHFNSHGTSLADVGYMHNKIYNYQQLSVSHTLISNTAVSLTNWLSYWYAGSINLKSSRYELVNSYQISSDSDRQNLIGKYTLRKSSKTDTSTTAYRIEAINGLTMYYKEFECISLSSNYYYGDSYDYGETVSGKYTIHNATQWSTNTDITGKYVTYGVNANSIYYVIGMNGNTISTERLMSGNTLRYNDSLVIGDYITDNENGTFSLNSPTSVSYSDWFENYESYKGKYTCGDISSICEIPRYIISVSRGSYRYANITHFGESVSWDGSKYALNNALIGEKIDLDDISTHHYICVDSIGTECTSVGYIYYHTEFNYINYILLENGVETVEEVINEMLFNNDVNSTDSEIKRMVEEWYYNNLLEYDSYLEETIYCNDRSISDFGGWKDDGGMTDTALYFKEYNTTSDLSCSNVTDQFSVNNSKAKLKYKVGITSNPEMALINNNTARVTGVWYWQMSPSRYSNYSAAVRVVGTDGGFGTTDSNYIYNARPSISLIPGISPSSGSGTMADPYVIDTSGA